METWRSLAVVSLTINGIFYGNAFGQYFVKCMAKRRREPAQAGKESQSGNGFEVWTKHNKDVIPLLLDSLLTFALFIGAMYVMITGNIMTKVYSYQSTTTNNTANVLMLIAIGRHIANLVRDLRRISRLYAVVCLCNFFIMETLMNFLTIVWLTAFVITKQGFSSGMLMLVMCADQNIYILHILVEGRLSKEVSKTCKRSIKLLQCFLSLAFRFTVPVVYISVFFAMNSQYRNWGDIFMRNTYPVVTVSLVSSALLYGVFNAQMIFGGLRVLLQCSRSEDKEKLLLGHKDARITSTIHNNIKTLFPRKVYTLTDMENHVANQLPSPSVEGVHILPPPYKYSRKVPNVSVGPARTNTTNEECRRKQSNMSDNSQQTKLKSASSHRGRQHKLGQTPVTPSHLETISEETASQYSQ